MAASSGQSVQADLLLPSLVDRLTDDDPATRTESLDRRHVSPAQLRDSVRRDLAALLNATQLGAVQDLEPYPEVARSTLNFGVPDLAGRTVSSVDTTTTARLLRRAITDFEPRLLASTLSVDVRVAVDSGEANALRIVIDASLWSQPIPVRLLLQARISLEDGETSVIELTGG